MKRISLIIISIFLTSSIARADYMPAGARLAPDVEIKSEQREKKAEDKQEDLPVSAIEQKPRIQKRELPKELILSYSISNIEARKLLRIKSDELSRQGSMLIAIGSTAALILAGVGMGLAIAGHKDLSTGKVVAGSIMSSTAASIGWTFISIGAHKKIRAKDLSLVYYALPEQTDK